MTGFEPAATWATTRCSATELHPPLISKWIISLNAQNFKFKLQSLSLFDIFIPKYKASGEVNIMDKKLKNAVLIVGIVLLVSLTVLVNVIISNQSLKSNFIGLDSQRLPSIQVSGEASVYAAPDTARISFSVITESEDTAGAITENNRKTGAVIDYLKEEGIEEKNIRTSGFSLRPLQQRKRDPHTGLSKTEIYGYRATNTVEVEVKDLEKTGTITGGAVRAGANSVRGLLFIVSNEEEFKKQAREKAVNRAREMAQEIALSLDASLGRIISFSEDRGFRAPMARHLMMEAADTAYEVPMEPGENEIKVRVSLEYEIR